MVKDLFDFIKKSPTAFHAVDSAKEILDRAGFKALSEKEKWDIKLGKKYYVTRNDSSIIAFVLPKKKDCMKFRIISSHTDSPMFKLKENACLETGGKYTRLNTEGYGGMILSSWLDKPLSVAGRVVYKRGDKLGITNINIDRDLVVIPNVAIHMNREINDGFKYNKQVDMLPLLGVDNSGESFERLIVDEVNKTLKKGKIKPADIVGRDLFLYNRSEGTLLGAKEEFIGAPRLDDLECVFASLKAIAETDISNNTLKVVACFDNEEVGSLSYQGAAGGFLRDVISRISISTGIDEETIKIALAEGFMLSADNAHAVHPNHPEKTDENNKVYMNEGVVVKTNASQKYTSDGMGVAMLKLCAETKNIPLQYFSNRSDAPGGSTLGNLSEQQISIPTVDIGLAQLAMHSSFETAGAKDLEYMVELMENFLYT